jgi:hypothetical protein
MEIKKKSTEYVFMEGNYQKANQTRMPLGKESKEGENSGITGSFCIGINGKPECTPLLAT